MDGKDFTDAIDAINELAHEDERKGHSVITAMTLLIIARILLDISNSLKKE